MNIPQSELDKLENEKFVNELDEQASEEETNEDEQIEQTKEEVSSSTEEDVVADKARIPYSRFETVNEAKIRAEERNKILEEELAKLKVSKDSNEDVEEPPKEWLILYGDSPEAREAWKIQLNISQQLEEKAAEKAYERIAAREQEEAKIFEQNLESIEDSLIEFQEKILKRDLTETEENAILDIQDEFTPKGEDGKYLAPLLSPDKAFEIYNLRQQTANKTKSIARKRVVSLTGAGTEGNVSNSSADFNPSQWGSWRDKL